MDKSITEKQFFILLDRGFSRDTLRHMSCAEARGLIADIAREENWPSSKKRSSSTKKGGGKKNKKRKSSKGLTKKEKSVLALDQAGHKCLKCGTYTNPKAFNIGGVPQKAVMCSPCYQVVVQAALMEFTPEYHNTLQESS